MRKFRFDIKEKWAAAKKIMKMLRIDYIINNSRVKVPAIYYVEYLMYLCTLHVT